MTHPEIRNGIASLKEHKHLTVDQTEIMAKLETDNEVIREYQARIISEQDEIKDYQTRIDKIETSKWDKEKYQGWIDDSQKKIRNLETWIVKLRNFKIKKVRQLESGFGSKVWYYRELYKVDYKYNNKYYRGWYCYDCKGSFAMSYEKEKEGNRPIQPHEIFVEKKLVNSGYSWKEKVEETYCKAVCCKCYDNCDCLDYIKEKRQENQKSTKERETEKEVLIEVIRVLDENIKNCQTKEKVGKLVEKELKGFRDKTQNELDQVGDRLEKRAEQKVQLSEWESKVKELLKNKEIK